jgi:hypothetical protein
MIIYFSKAKLSQYVEFRYTECIMLLFIMFTIVVLSVIRSVLRRVLLMLSLVILSIVILCVAFVSVIEKSADMPHVSLRRVLL